MKQSEREIEVNRLDEQDVLISTWMTERNCIESEFFSDYHDNLQCQVVRIKKDVSGAGGCQRPIYTN